MLVPMFMLVSVPEPMRVPEPMLVPEPMFVPTLALIFVFEIAYMYLHLLHC
jgi:hypothetical protein